MALDNQGAYRLRGDVGGEEENETATAFCALASTVVDRIRSPLNRQTTMMLTSASMAVSMPKPKKATDPASTAARIAMPHSMPSQPRLIQLIKRAGQASTNSGIPVSR